MCVTRNCRGKGDPKQTIIPLGKNLILHECPVSYIRAVSNYWLALFWNCHSFVGGELLRHSLPEAGGLLDQDNATIEAFEVIEAEIRQHLLEKEK